MGERDKEAIVPNLVCETCGEGFWQGRGRPARRCGRCRGGDRYGSAHQAMRAATVDQAVGQLCVRCQLPMLPGQEVQLDHADDDPTRYLGYSHKQCNLSAGAAKGNRARAAAYRQLRGAILDQAVPVNGSGAVVVREPPPDRPNCHRTREEIGAAGGPLPCVCGRRNSRCW
jgi:hypothetical protein